jgi:hypothetical protein
MTTLSVAKQAIDITKDLRNIDEKIDAAIWKLKLSDLVDKLIDTKDALIEAKDRERELLSQIDALEAKLTERGKYKDRDGLLWELDENQNEMGEPFCNHCYVKEDKRFRMRHNAAGVGLYAHYHCDNCKTNIRTGPSLPRPPSSKRARFI